MADTQPMRSGPQHAHETRDVHFWPIVWFSLVLLLTVVVAVVGLDALMGYLGRTRTQPEREFSALAAQQLPPAPRLETASGVELQDLRAREQELLGSYAWVDREGGIARIPIERAMALLAQQGLPVREQPPGAAAGAGGDQQPPATGGQASETDSDQESRP